MELKYAIELLIDREDKHSLTFGLPVLVLVMMKPLLKLQGMQMYANVLKSRSKNIFKKKLHSRMP